MKIDMHFHVLGNGNNLDEIDSNVYFCPEDNHLLFTRILYNLIEEEISQEGWDLDSDGKISTEEYFNLVFHLLSRSKEIDGIVLLALDAVYSPRTKKLNKKKTDLWVSNRFLNTKVIELNERLNDEGITDKAFYLGASVSPNRADWETELDYVINQTEAVLLKWIPSTQHIHVSDVKHKPFYEALAEAGLPLLCHVGPELSFPEGIRMAAYDNFRFLEKPLEYGVTVIAAHCASPVFAVLDKNEIREFFALMKSANEAGASQMWADTSALSLSTRIPLIPELVRTFPSEWLVHGSDFPIPIDGWPHLPWVTHDMTPEEYREIIAAKNPLDRDVLIKRAHGFSDSILGNAEDVLRLPDS